MALVVGVGALIAAGLFSVGSLDAAARYALDALSSVSMLFFAGSANFSRRSNPDRLVDIAAFSMAIVSALVIGGVAGATMIAALALVVVASVLLQFLVRWKKAPDAR